ncbi:hypothetical protein [Vibrio sp. SCSIO 43186]|nr:hypothetical protein [Vibrio sp. SCSIO 43186]
MRIDDLGLGLGCKLWQVQNQLSSGMNALVKAHKQASIVRSQAQRM